MGSPLHHECWASTLSLSWSSQPPNALLLPFYFCCGCAGVQTCRGQTRARHLVSSSAAVCRIDLRQDLSEPGACPHGRVGSPASSSDPSVSPPLLQGWAWGMWNHGGFMWVLDPHVYRVGDLIQGAIAQLCVCFLRHSLGWPASHFVVYADFELDGFFLPQPAECWGSYHLHHHT